MDGVLLYAYRTEHPEPVTTRTDGEMPGFASTTVPGGYGIPTETPDENGVYASDSATTGKTVGVTIEGEVDGSPRSAEAFGTLDISGVTTLLAGVAVLW